jgi:hypothetical protein
LRVYQGTPRRAYADVLRAIGAVLDRGGMRSVLLVEVEQGFIAQGHASTQTDRRNAWGSLTRVELHFWDADIAREMQSAVDRRGSAHVAGPNEFAFRLLGGYIDAHTASDLMALEQQGTWLVRCMPAQAEGHYTFVEFTPEDLANLAAESSTARKKSFLRW